MSPGDVSRPPPGPSAAAVEGDDPCRHCPSLTWPHRIDLTGPGNSQFDPLEPAMKYKYSARRNCWVPQRVYIRMCPTPLGQGCMRIAFPMAEYYLPSGEAKCVAKMSKRSIDGRAVYFAEVRMQAKCQALAKEYNKFHTPKKVNFIECWVVECRRRGHPSGEGCLTLVAEPLLEGAFRKYNNNTGFVDRDLMRSTPHAFSHWTFHFTRGTLLVCDIQGVEDTYTDPQIHSNTDDGWVYGKGDFGREGIERFFETHVCNGLCRYLKLPERPRDQRLPPVQWAPLEDLVPASVVERVTEGLWVRPPDDPPTDDAPACPVSAAAAAALAAACIALASILQQRGIQRTPSRAVAAVGTLHPPSHVISGAGPSSTVTFPTSTFVERSSLNLDVGAIAASLAYPISHAPTLKSPHRMWLTPDGPRRPSWCPLAHSHTTGALSSPTKAPTSSPSPSSGSSHPHASSGAAAPTSTHAITRVVPGASLSSPPPPAPLPSPSLLTPGPYHA